MWQRIIADITGIVMRLLPTRAGRPDNEHLRRLEFKTSTRKMGVRFTEKIRDTWRRRWLKIHRDD